ncbi:MAG: DUF6512 family protein [Oscillibacter sp.]|jgi:hypothetical protein|nr:DUF6512 family protein [Oscillibacter sp.]
MGKKLRYWELAGFIFTAGVGALLHFLYGWSGGNRVAAAFSAVNESTWEHMKILVLPALLFSAVQFCVQGRSYPNFPAVRSFSILAGAALIPVGFYTYTGILGRDVLWADLALFLAADALIFLLDARGLQRGSLSAGIWQILGVAVLWALVFAFVWCTFHPPMLALFRDPVTGQYGIPTVPAAAVARLRLS